MKKGSAGCSALARDALATGTTAGLAIAVVRDGTVVFARGFGARDLARQRSRALGHAAAAVGGGR